ncbi:uncharacterized protein (DUF1697 family) [Phyllobacterium trifolii]|uniref:Uncharacterized protein (DUF1697 family) n=1 Tax=Phyllobacterium trifolii TaxID=300193 RepID=A0A839UCG5_9HYPH|nr:DUF1697 domain-containing protein [Phyllobacterium trifolii]MBB3147625.1 uncharacterized protein (DUF1697 family) [Phyllobacterium trifolii]
MTCWIILFRGVGGDTLLPVQPLKAALVEEGFESVVTYINTGNVVLTSNDRPKRIAKRVATTALEHFGFSKHIMIVSRAEWAKLITQNPFPLAVSEPAKLHAYVLERTPDAEAVKALEQKATGPEQFEIRGRVLYYYAPHGVSNARLHPKIEKTLKVAATARNWNTVLKLAHLAKQMAGDAK